MLDPAARTLTYATAGHNPPRLVARRARASRSTQTGGLPLGILDDQAVRRGDRPLEPGDLLLLYTDGITEAMAPAATATAARELFGVERLDQLLLDCGGNGAAGCIGRVRAEVAAFSENAPPTDDQTLIAIRCV